MKTRIVSLCVFGLVAALPLTAQPFQLGTSGPNLQVGGIAAFDGTNYLVGFQENPTSQNGYVGAELFSKAGTAVMPYLSTGATGGFGMVAFDGTNYLMVWGDDATQGISGCFINKSGAIVGSRFPISDQGAHGNYGAVYGGGQYLVWWSNGTTANGRFVPASLAQSGVLSTTSFAVNPSGSAAVPVGMGVGFDGTNFLVAWESQLSSTSYEVDGRFMTPAGSMGTPFAISQATDAIATDYISIAYDGSLDYLVVWDSNASTGSSIYARTVAKNGTFPGSKFTVASTGAGNQFFAPGAASDGTNFLVTWATYLANGSSNVYAQFFNPAGVSQGAAIAPFTGNVTMQPKFAAPLFDGSRFLLVGFVGTSTSMGDHFTSGDTFGTFLAGTPATAPAFTTQPTGQTVNAGGNASFTVAASGIPAPAYQWQVSTNGGTTWTNLADAAPYSGTATATLTITGATAALNNCQYKCLAMNSAQSVASNIATLTVTQSGSAPFQLGTSGPNLQVGGFAAFDGTNYLVGFQENPSSQDYVGVELFSKTGTAVVPYLSTGALGGEGMVAFDGTNYLMVWGDDADQGISGCFINKSGAIVGAQFPISDQGAHGNYGAVYGGGQYLVWWSNGTTANGRFVPASLAQSGVLSTTSFAVNPSGSTAVPVGMGVAFDGTNFPVAWESRLSSNSYEVNGRFMTPAGSMGTPFAISQGTDAIATDYISIAYDGSLDYLVVWDSNASTGSSIYARTVAKNGTFPGSKFTVASTGAGNQFFGPGAASDGTNFLVTWATYLANGSSNVYAQFFNPAGVSQGAAIAPFTANGANQPEFAAPLFDGSRFLLVGFVGTSTSMGDHFTSGATYGTFLPATAGTAPAFATQPASQTVAAGQSAIFSAAATGFPAPTYQWQVSTDGGSTWTNLTDTAPYSGTATATLTVAPAGFGSAQFRVVSTNSTGAATGDPVTVTALPSSPGTAGLLWGPGTLLEGLGFRVTSVAVASGVTSVKAGYSHTLYLKTGGTLWAMGQNADGQLGDGTTTDRNTPVQVASGVAKMTAGGNYTLFIKTDGTLWATGYNSAGNLGDGTYTGRNTPVQVATGVASVTAANITSFFIKTDGTLWGMGDNRLGQLGAGTNTGPNTPVQVASGVASVTCAGAYSLFVKTDGTLWAMGQNTYGQLGDGTTTDRSTPVQVASGAATVITGCQGGLPCSLFIKTDRDPLGHGQRPVRPARRRHNDQLQHAGAGGDRRGQGCCRL